MRHALTALCLAGTLLTLAPRTVLAQTAPGTTKAKYSTIYLTSGESFYGSVISLNAKEVQFMAKGVGPLTFLSRHVQKVKTPERTYVYSPVRGGFVAEEAPAPAASSPAAKAKPAPAASKAEPIAAAPAGKTQTVVVVGLGETAEMAERDAYRNAVRSVVGFIVDSEQSLKQDVLEDKILVYSDGFVASRKILEQKQTAGQFYVKIEAEVKRRSLVEKLRAANIAVGKLDGGGLFAEIVTQMQAERDAQQLLEHALKGYPFGCIKAELRGKPVVLQRDDDQVLLRLNFDIQADEKAYGLFVERLRNTLAGVARTRGEFSLSIRATGPNQYILGSPQGTRKNPLQDFAGKSVTMVTLAKYAPQVNERFYWEYFVLDGAISKKLRGLAQKTGQVRVKLLDEQERIVAEDRFALEVSEFAENGMIRVPTGDRSHVNIIYPLLLLSPELSSLLGRASDPPNGGQAVPPLCDYFLLSPVFFRGSPGQFMLRLSVLREVRLSLQQLRIIQSARCEVDFE
jgi:hypothetical protein